MKRVALMQDLSGIGKCSLSVAIPILAAMGVETAILPTAVLSNHTAFSSFTFRDLTEDIEGILVRWQEESLCFHAFYSGYLASPVQISMVRRAYTLLDPILRLVDPVMGDHGRLYRGFDASFVREMKGLCREAHILLPNQTEACLLTGRPYREGASLEEYKDLLKYLAQLGPESLVLTGVGSREDRLGALAYHRERGDFFLYEEEKIQDSFHGTGDIFASVCVGSLVRSLPEKRAMGDRTQKEWGTSIERAVSLAVHFVATSLRETLREEERTCGVSFERALPILLSGDFQGN